MNEKKSKTRPKVFVVAGPNGSGKTTFAEEFLPKWVGVFNFINADYIAKGLSGFSSNAVALKAGRILLEQIDACASKKINFAFETTLSGTAYLSRIKNLKKLGYEVHLYFLWIPEVKLSIARVESRVKMGGHDIREKVIRRRFKRGLKNLLQKYALLADSWTLLDNSGEKPRAIVSKQAGSLEIKDGALWRKILAMNGGKE